MKRLYRAAKTHRGWLYRAGLLLGAALFLQQVGHGLEGLRAQRFHFSDATHLAAAAGIIFVAYALQMLAWQQLMYGLGRSIGVLEVFRGYILSFLPRYIPGTVWGYLSRGEWLKRNHGVPYTESTYSSLLEVAVGLLTAGVTAAICYASTGGYLSLQLTLIPGLLLVPWLAWLGLNFITRLPLLRRFESAWSRASPGAGIDFYRWLSAYLLYILFWLCYGISTSLILSAFGYTRAGLVQTTLVYTLAWLVGFVILFAPAGLGVREVMLSGLLAWQFQAPPQAGSAVAVTGRLAIYAAELTWLLMGLILSWNQGKTSRGPTESHLQT